MSTGKPAPRGKSASTNMAVSTKPSDCKQAAVSKESKLHRRSRTGCFTCRLRRKKCEEGKPMCRACRHLGLTCEYKRPMWWSNNEQRRQQKEIIKDIIKHTKLTEKAASAVPLPGNTPPSLCHSISDGIPRTRGGSMDSQFSGEFNFNGLPSQHDFEFPLLSEPALLSDPSMLADPALLADPTLLADPSLMALPPHCGFPALGPITAYEVDVRTEKQLFINDVELQRDSTTSTFTTYPVVDDPTTDDQAFPTESWVQQHYFDHSQETFRDPAPELPNGAGCHGASHCFFDFPSAGNGFSEQSRIEVEEHDQYLLNHFLENLLRFAFPVLEVNKPGSTRSAVILPAMESNKPLLHCCLSTAGIHLQASSDRKQPKHLAEDVQRHQHMTISTLTAALGSEPDDPQLLQAALGQIFLDSFAGPPAANHTIKLPWQEHFKVALDVINRQNLHFQLRYNTPPTPTPSPLLSFDMALTAWIDILGGAMRGYGSPTFADIYREKLDGDATIGLSELMGCDDKVMFLISEIACLEGAKKSGQLDDISTCMFIKRVGDVINLTEPPPGSLDSAISASGAIRPAQLATNITALFRIAARIYLCFCLPDFDPRQPNIANLVSSFVDAWEFLPGGRDGFDRAVAWPLLVAGSVAGRESSFRGKLAERVRMMGSEASVGSFGRVNELLGELWRINDDLAARGEVRSVHWRDVMAQNEWDFLLI